MSRTWSKWHRTRRCHCLRKSENIASASSSSAPYTLRRRRWVVLTGVGNRLVVLDRLQVGGASVRRRSNGEGEQWLLQSLEQRVTHHCAGCGSSPRSLWLSNKSPVVKRLQFGGRSLGGAPKFLAGLGNPIKAVCGSESPNQRGGAATGGGRGGPSIVTSCVPLAAAFCCVQGPKPTPQRRTFHQSKQVAYIGAFTHIR
jgi:hypothetical protein